MILAHAIHMCEFELICDFAEVYHVYDYKSLPPRTAGIFVYGLRDDSRTKMKMAGEKVEHKLLLLALIHDRLALISEQLSGGNYKPELIATKLLESEEPKKNFEVFKTAEEFHGMYKEIAERRGK